VSLENHGQVPDPNEQRRQPTSELWGPWGQEGEGRQETQFVPGTQPGRPMESETPAGQNNIDVDPQFTHREHVSGALHSDPAEAPLFRPAYPPYPAYPGYPPQVQGQGYPAPLPYVGYPPQRPGYPPYPGYPPPTYTPPYSSYNGYPTYPYGYPWPPQPKRDGYLFGVAIASLIGSSLVLLAGLGAAGLLALIALVPHTNLSASEYFSGVMLLIGLVCAGIVGGGFGLYHSIRSAFLRKPSADFAMPPFWIFVLLYVAVLGVGYWLQRQGLAVTYLPLTVVLIALAGIFPALAVLALGDRRLHFPRWAHWPTSWRRFTLAIVSGATLGVGLAAVLEFGLEIFLVRGQSVNPLLCVNQPNAPNCQDPSVYTIILLTVAVMAPLVEEAVKPLAVVVLIGRILSAAEAFVLGLACGIGFDLIETTGYISSGYQDWLSVALTRTGSGLLHGFGAAMVALGWYYITHPEAGQRRVLKALGCWLYAVLQHALWNGSLGLVLLPAPVGPFFNHLNLIIGPVNLPSYEIINIVEMIFILVFFIYMMGRVRTKAAPPPSSPPEKRDTQPVAASAGGAQSIRAQ
jgi:RsiW-degrading membrane proteinase PrsW (M82 family)